MEETELLEIVETNPLCRGVTFSGGEPFSQAQGFAKLGRLLKEKGYEVASYSGYTFEELLEGTEAQKDLLSVLDVLIDGPFLLSQRSLELNFRGSRNQRVLNVPQSLREGKAVLETSPRWLGEY
jgi:anaerobic ribonucleoside-triphosphate reductase activating protein